MNINNEWIDCVVDSDYEICTTYPHQIRKKSNERVISEWNNNKGYVCCKLNGKPYKKHRIIASQWIENDDPDNKTQVDHINHIPDDNHIENLRWCTQSTNQRNRTAYNGVKVNYLDELSEDAFEITAYGDYEFEDLWYDPESDKFYYYTGVNYREISIGMHKGSAIIKARDVDNERRQISINKFKRLYNIN